MNQAASKLNVEQSVVKRWIISGKLVGLINKKGELRVPKARIRDGRIAPYLDNLHHIFEKPADLWQYLVVSSMKVVTVFLQSADWRKTVNASVRSMPVIHIKKGF